jgi:tetratricopeptide (TPR) repeat protein
MSKFVALIATSLSVAIFSPAAYSATTVNSFHQTNITPVQQIAQDPEALLNSALTKYGNKDLKGALADMNEFIRLRPDVAPAYILRGSIKDDLGDVQGALKDYGKAISLDGKQYFAYFERGVTYSRLKKYPEAISDYKKAISIKPDFAPAHRNLGLVKYSIAKNQSEADSAIADIQKAITLYEQQGDKAKAQETRELLKKIQQA